MSSAFTHHIERIIDKYRLLQPGDRVLVGVSGGADSVALLLVLDELGYETGAAHLNHGLRGADSDADEEFTRRLAARLHAPFFAQRTRLDEQGGNLEAAGREARKAFFRSIQAGLGFTKIALAHNREDRIETFLLHLLRGAGTEGLVSMAPVSGDVVRPLIESSRTEIEAYLDSRGQPWRTDATNEDLKFSRNRLRHSVIPGLMESFNPRLPDALSRTIEVLYDEDRWLRSLAQGWMDEHASLQQDEVSLSADALRSAPAPLARRVIRSALRMMGSPLTDLTFEHVEKTRGLAEPGKSGKILQFPGGLHAAREFDRLVFRLSSALTPEFDYALPIPGSVYVREIGQTFRAEVVQDIGGGATGGRVFVDGEGLEAYVRIRNWKPGDYYKPAGLPSGKLKKLFQQARIPRSRRNRCPVLVAGPVIVWVASFPVSREFVPCAQSQKIVAFEAVPD